MWVVCHTLYLGLWLPAFRGSHGYFSMLLPYIPCLSIPDSMVLTLAQDTNVRIHKIEPRLVGLSRLLEGVCWW